MASLRLEGVWEDRPPQDTRILAHWKYASSSFISMVQYLRRAVSLKGHSFLPDTASSSGDDNDSTQSVPPIETTEETLSVTHPNHILAVI